MRKVREAPLTFKATTSTDRCWPLGPIATFPGCDASVAVVLLERALHGR
jgi:hypothetical protein